MAAFIAAVLVSIPPAAVYVVLRLLAARGARP